jgi:hypothetical protein
MKEALHSRANQSAATRFTDSSATPLVINGTATQTAAFAVFGILQ